MIILPVFLRRPSDGDEPPTSKLTDLLGLATMICMVLFAVACVCDFGMKVVTDLCLATILLLLATVLSGMYGPTGGGR